MSRWVVDASLTLGWYLQDEQDRTYNLEVLAGWKENEGVVPFIWTYEISNGLVMAHRRKRITSGNLAEIWYHDGYRYATTTYKKPSVPSTPARWTTASRRRRRIARN